MNFMPRLQTSTCRAFLLTGPVASGVSTVGKLFDDHLPQRFESVELDGARSDTLPISEVPTGRDVVVTGVKSPEQVRYFENEYDECITVYVSADYHTRYHRALQNPEHADDLSKQVFQQLDVKRYRDGVCDILSEYKWDYIVDNNGPITGTEEQVKDVVNKADSRAVSTAVGSIEVTNEQ